MKNDTNDKLYSTKFKGELEFTELENFFKNIGRAPSEDYVVFMNNSSISSNKIYFNETQPLSQKMLSIDALYNYADEIATYFVKYRDFPKILFVIDTLTWAQQSEYIIQAIENLETLVFEKIELLDETLYKKGRSAYENIINPTEFERNIRGSAFVVSVKKFIRKSKMMLAKHSTVESDIHNLAVLTNNNLMKTGNINCPLSFSIEITKEQENQIKNSNDTWKKTDLDIDFIKKIYTTGSSLNLEFLPLVSLNQFNNTSSFLATQVFFDNIPKETLDIICEKIATILKERLAFKDNDIITKILKNNDAYLQSNKIEFLNYIMSYIYFKEFCLSYNLEFEKPTIEQKIKLDAMNFMVMKDSEQLIRLLNSEDTLKRIKIIIETSINNKVDDPQTNKPNLQYLSSEFVKPFRNIELSIMEFARNLKETYCQIADMHERILTINKYNELSTISLTKILSELNVENSKISNDDNFNKKIIGILSALLLEKSGFVSTGFNYDKTINRMDYVLKANNLSYLIIFTKIPYILQMFAQRSSEFWKWRERDYCRVMPLYSELLKEENFIETLKSSNKISDEEELWINYFLDNTYEIITKMLDAGETCGSLSRLAIDEFEKMAFCSDYDLERTENQKNGTLSKKFKQKLLTIDNEWYQNYLC